MNLIMRTEFDNLRLNDNHQYETDKSGNKAVVKIWKGDELIAKKITEKKLIRYFGCKNYKEYLSS
jgi:hypothetical protein